MRIYHNIMIILAYFLFFIMVPVPVWAVEPDPLLYSEEKTVRDARYREKRQQLAELLRGATEEKTKQNLQLQQQLLTKLGELPDRPEGPSIDLQFAASESDAQLSWGDFQQFLDRFIQLIMEEKVSEQQLKETREQRQSLYNRLIGLGEQGPEQDLLQLQYAYQVRKNTHQSLIERELKEGLQNGRERFPEIVDSVHVDSKRVVKQTEDLSTLKENLQQLKDGQELAAAEHDALIEQQESVVAGYLGLELTDSDKRVMHFERLKLLEQQVRRLAGDIQVVKAEISLYGEQQRACWYQLFSTTPNFYTLSDSAGEISKQLSLAMEKINDFHTAIYAHEKELSTLRGGNALTGPKAKELIAKLDEEVRAIFTELSGAGQRVDIFLSKGQLLSRGIGLKQSAIGSVVTRTREATDNIMERAVSVLKYPLISYSGMHVSLLLLLQVLALLLFGIISNRLFGYIVQRTGNTRKWSERTVHLVQAAGKYPLIFLVAMILLSVVGINTSSLALVAGALSLGIGFGMQTIVNNLVSGIILLFDKSIRPGDYISLDENSNPGGFRGNVVQMNIRATVLRTNDNINIIIPNADLMASQVVNWTYSDERVRFRIPFSVAYGTDIERLKTIIKEALESLPVVLSQPEPQIWMAEHGESSLAFIAAIWVEGQSTRQPSRTRDAALTVIYQTLLAHDIEIPYPQVDLRLRDTSCPPREVNPLPTAVGEMVALRHANHGYSATFQQ